MAVEGHLLGLPVKHKPGDINPQGAGSGLNADTVDGLHAAEIGGAGDMLKSVYDQNANDVVDDSEKLEGSTKTEVQNHAPQAHNHDDLYYTETEIDVWKHDDENEGHGNGFDADTVDGMHASDLGGGGGLPSGVILMWSGLIANIPAGFALCDGQNGTPDLRNRFILSVGTSEEPGGTGGSTSYSHSGTAVADHAALTHTGTAVDAHSTVANLRTGGGAVGFASVGDASHNVTQPSDHATLSHNVTQPNGHTGVQPPYYKLAFIMKV